MIAAIASGKGGTGKTTVSASLTSVWTEATGRPVLAVDLDVEEPNLHLFLRPLIATSRVARLETPVVDAAACTRCGACIRRCPARAVGKEFADRDKPACANYAIHEIGRDREHAYGWMSRELGCALCQTGVPCEFRRPGSFLWGDAAQGERNF